MMWYMTTEPHYVSVLRVGVRDLGWVEWSRRRCTSPAFWRILIFSNSRGHQTLAVTSLGTPRGVGAAFGPINTHLLTIQTTFSYFYELGFYSG